MLTWNPCPGRQSVDKSESGPSPVEEEVVEEHDLEWGFGIFGMSRV